MVDVIAERVIPAPRAKVAAYAADPGHAPSWYTNIHAVEWVDEPGVREGARVAFVARFLGRRLAYTYEIVEWAPDARLVMRTSDGPFPMETTYTWEDAGPDATRMTLRNRGAPSGFSRLVAPFMATMMRRAMRKDLAALERVLTAPAPA